MIQLSELQEQIMTVPYVELEPHMKRDAVLWISPHLDLAQVGLALAADDKASVQKWLTEKHLRKADTLDLESWRSQKKFFKILIVQPFVVAQDLHALAD